LPIRKIAGDLGSSGMSFFQSAIDFVTTHSSFAVRLKAMHNFTWGWQVLINA
jgi:hypothetical protein